MRYWTQRVQYLIIIRTRFYGLYFCITFTILSAADHTTMVAPRNRHIGIARITMKASAIYIIIKYSLSINLFLNGLVDAVER